MPQLELWTRCPSSSLKARANNKDTPSLAVEGPKRCWTGWDGWQTIEESHCGHILENLWSVIHLPSLASQSFNWSHFLECGQENFKKKDRDRKGEKSKSFIGGSLDSRVRADRMKAEASLTLCLLTISIGAGVMFMFWLCCQSKNHILDSLLAIFRPLVNSCLSLILVWEY